MFKPLRYVAPALLCLLACVPSLVAWASSTDSPRPVAAPVAALPFRAHDGPPEFLPYANLAAPVLLQEAHNEQVLFSTILWNNTIEKNREQEQALQQQRAVQQHQTVQQERVVVQQQQVIPHSYGGSVANCVKSAESGVYSESSHIGAGSGAYQFVPSTWQHYFGAWAATTSYNGPYYSYAYQAPAAIQDDVFQYTITHGGAHNWDPAFGNDSCTVHM